MSSPIPVLALSMWLEEVAMVWWWRPSALRLLSRSRGGMDGPVLADVGRGVASWKTWAARISLPSGAGGRRVVSTGCCIALV